jgi:excisionase family DNA binding protein
VNAHVALSFSDPHWSPVSRVGTTVHEDSRLVKGTPMGKISIISRRRRNKQFPDTEAQRRARGRELEEADNQQALPIDGLTALSEVLSLELSECRVDDFGDTTVLNAFADTEELTTPSTATPQTLQGMAVRLQLSPEQSLLLHTLPFAAETPEQPVQPLIFDLTKSQNEHGIVLQFSLHAEAVPQMLSLKDLCHQLKVGRQSAIRLMRAGKLRYYRIGKRYRFVASEVKQDLEHNAAQEM